MNRRNLQVLVSFVALTLVATVPAFGQSDNAQPSGPTGFLHAQVAELGLGLSATGSSYGARLLGLTYGSEHLEFGISGFETEGSTTGMHDEASSSIAFLALRCRYNFFERRIRTGFLYNSLPSCYAEAAVSGLDINGDGTGLAPHFYWRLSLGTEVEYYGIGLGLEAGMASTAGRRTASYGMSEYLQLKFHLLNGSFGLWLPQASPGDD